MQINVYTGNKSTESALHQVVCQIEVANFIDIEGAFDKINFTSIEAAQINHGTSPVVTNWFKYMLSKRTVRFMDDPRVALVAKGCPQGVLSPLCGT